MKRILRLSVLVWVTGLSFGCGGERWTVEQAKEEAFGRIPAQFDVSNYPAQDPHFQENQEALRKGQRFIGNRGISSNPTPPVGYIVSEFDERRVQTLTTYYRSDGQAISVRIFSGPDLPRAAYIYCLDVCDAGKDGMHQAGGLMSVAWHVSGLDVFYFSPKGKLNAHLKE